MDSLYISHVVTGRMQGNSLHQLSAKELGVCIMVNWYPPTLSISLDSEGSGMPCDDVVCCVL